MKPIKRGCGERSAGSVYGMCPTSPTGTPVWNFLLDPPVPYHEGLFRGIKFAQDEALGDGWDNGSILLIDWIGAEAYPTLACWVEEVRRFGMSRKFPASFPLERLAGKEVWLAVIHKRAVHEWETALEDGPAYANCKRANSDSFAWHYPRCVYHSWGTAMRFHEDTGGTQVPFVNMGWADGVDDQRMGYWMGFWPWDAVVKREDELMLYDLIEQVRLLPQCTFAPGVFGVFPIKHFEAIKHIPDKCKVAKSGLEVQIVDD